MADIPILKLRHSFPVFAVVGIVRPRLFVAEHVLETLDEQELTAVLRHELGHITALDNLKRLAIKLCGDLLVAPLGRGLDRDWSVAAEAAADEYAVAAGDRNTALSLAGALHQDRPHHSRNTATDARRFLCLCGDR